MKKNGWIALIAGMIVVCLCITLVAGGAVAFYVTRQMRQALSEDGPLSPTRIEPRDTPEPTHTPRPLVRSTLPPTATGSKDTGAPSNVSNLQSAVLPKADLADLAVRYRGVSPDKTEVKCDRLAPGYEVGATRTFTLTNNDNDSQFQITARLEYKTDHIYMWVERDPERLRLDSTRLKRAADRFEEQIYPTTRDYFGSERTPGVDCDPHLAIVHAAGLGSTVGGYFSSADSYPLAVRDDSNEVEMFVINAARGYNGERPNSDTYMSTLAHEFQHMISHNNVHTPDLWLEEGAAQFAERLNGYGDSVDTVYSFADAPETQLNTWADSSAGDNAAHYGGGYLFWSYLYDRFGDDITKKLGRSPERSVNAFMKVLADEKVVNPDTNKPLTFEDLYADFMIANYMNQQKLDDKETRYHYSSISVPPMSKHATYRQNDYPVNVNEQVNQFGTNYIELHGDAAVTIKFTGSTVVPLLPLDNSSGQFWWSNRADSSNSRLTREVDLTKLNQGDKATLKFKAWYWLEENFDYAFASVSEDGGTTWQTIKTSSCTTENPQSSNLGCGYTGASGKGDPPQWLDEQSDLSAFVGKKILLRFEMVTDAAVNRDGLVIDDIEIPEIGFADDAEGDTGWQAEGFVRVDNNLPQQWQVRVLSFTKDGSVTLNPIVLTDNIGTQTVNFGDNVDYTVLVISASTQSTTEAGTYQLEIK